MVFIAIYSKVYLSYFSKIKLTIWQQTLSRLINVDEF